MMLELIAIYICVWPLGKCEVVEAFPTLKECAANIPKYPAKDKQIVGCGPYYYQGSE